MHVYVVGDLKYPLLLSQKGAVLVPDMIRCPIIKISYFLKKNSAGVIVCVSFCNEHCIIVRNRNVCLQLFGLLLSLLQDMGSIGMP